MPAYSTETERTLLRAENVKKHFAVETTWTAVLRGRRPVVKALDGVSLDVRKSETLGVVGESGSGKSTLGRILLRLIEPSDGRVLFEGNDLFDMSSAELRRFRRRVQVIFQDPYASLDPRMHVGDIIREPLDIYGEGTRAQREKRMLELLGRVGLSPSHARSYPSSLSGGQRQRVGIAAALALAPDLIIADEAVSSLDVSVQAQILNLLAELREEYGLALMFISHDLSVIRHISDRVVVMYLGRILEEAPTEDLFDDPRHPYTQFLLSAIPKPDPRQRTEPRLMEGEPPSPIDPPSGCRFHPRCPGAKGVCAQREPELMTVGQDHRVACFLDAGQSTPEKGQTPEATLKGD